MTPAKYNIEIVRGITFSVVFTFKDADDAAVDLTGWKVFAEARLSPSKTVAFDLGPEITDAAAGEVTIAYTDEESKALADFDGRWDLVLEQPDGQRFGPFVAGPCRVSTIISQPA